MRVADLIKCLSGLNPNADLKITHIKGGLTTWIKIVPYGNNEVWLTPFSEEPDSSWYDINSGDWYDSWGDKQVAPLCDVVKWISISEINKEASE